MRVSAVTVLVLVVLLAGCGGGGGPGTTPPTTPTADDPAATATATAPGPATGTATADSRPAWVDADGSVDGAALAERHDAALPVPYRLSAERTGGETLTLYEGADAARLDVGDGPRAGLYDAGTTSARLRSGADPPLAADYGSAPRPNADAAYAAVRGTYPGRYLAVADLSYDKQTDDGGHVVRIDGVRGSPDAPGTDGSLVDLSGTLAVDADGYVRSLRATETVRVDGDRVERSVTVGVDPVAAVPVPDWVEGAPRLRAASEDHGRALAVEHVGGPSIPEGSAVTLRNESTVLGTTTLNATLAPGDDVGVGLVAENDTERLVVTRNGSLPANATRLPADAYLVVETEAAVVRVGALGADAEE